MVPSGICREKHCGKLSQIEVGSGMRQAAVDFLGANRYKASGWCIGMQCRTSSNTLLAAVLATLFFISPAQLQSSCRGRAKHCHHSYSTGSHCPLGYDSHQSTPQHHPHTQQTAMPAAELHCRCNHTTAANTPLEVACFIQPRLAPVEDVPFALLPNVNLFIFLLEMFLTPPDPPPRALSSITFSVSN